MRALLPTGLAGAFAGFVLFVLAAPACTVSANVGDLDAVPDAASDGATSDAPTDGSTEGARDALGADALDDAVGTIDAGCGVDFPPQGGFIDVAPVQSNPPSYTGGAVVPGLYVLEAMRVYAASPLQGTMQVRERLRVRGSTTGGAFDVVTEARAPTGTFEAYPLHGETTQWTAGAGPVLFTTRECPAETFPDHLMNFQTDGLTLTITDPGLALERVYRRTP